MPVLWGRYEGGIEGSDVLMIKNQEYQTLFMDFSSMFPDNDHPSDIDMFYLCNDGTMIFGEIKSKYGTFGEGQKRLLSKAIDMHKGDGVGLYITHDKLVQQGDRVVDVSKCHVKEIYVKGEGEWRKPKKDVTVGEVLNYYKRRSKRVEG